MKKGAIGVGITMLLFILGGLAIAKQNQLDAKDRILKEKDIHINSLNNTLEEKEIKITEISELNKIYIDSIQVLNTKIFFLEKMVGEKDVIIKKLEGKIYRREKRLKKKNQEISKLYRKQKLDKNAIAKLRKEKSKIKEEIRYVHAKQEKVFAERAVKQKEIEDYRENILKMNMLTKIVEGTHVEYKKITGKKYRSGRKINRMKKHTTAWQYIDLEFVLSHSDHLLLLDQTFVLRLFDTEKDEMVAYLENNPKFPSNKSEGIPFQFDGNTIELTFINHQRKMSENYELRIYLKNENGDIPLENGVLPIVVNGRFIQL